MYKAEILFQLQSGEFITSEDAFSPFEIYSVKKNIDCCYILIPKSGIPELKDIIIVASESGIRICKSDGWPRKLVSKIAQVVNCPSQDKLYKIEYRNIPTDIQYSIANNLVNEYNKN